MFELLLRSFNLYISVNQHLHILLLSRVIFYNEKYQTTIIECGVLKMPSAEFSLFGHL
jgi:hypothetical protein